MNIDLYSSGSAPDTDLKSGNVETLQAEVAALKAELSQKERQIDTMKWAKSVAGSPEMMFKALFEGASTAIFIADAETGDILDCNACAAELIGYAREKLIGTHQTKLHPPEQADFYIRQFRQHTCLPSINNVDAVVQHADGRVIPVIISSRPVILDSRKLLVGFFTDISSLKRAEEELKAAKARAELYLDLMGHDINNLNQIAMGYLEFIRGQIYDASVGEMLEKPIDAIINSSRLIDNVRKLQKITIAGEKKPVCIREVMECACGQFAGLSAVSLTLDVPDSGNAVVMADELLNDVFTNLLGNAIKHRGQQEDLRLMVRLTGGYEEGDRYYKVTIDDNGPGISHERKEHLFDRFSRSSTKSKGSGLGLYLVKSLVHSYNGKVWVEDRVPGDHTQGAKFVVMLPALA